MSPLFDEFSAAHFAPVRDAVWFYNNDRATEPHMEKVFLSKNNHTQFREIIGFLTLGETVITNSYHGAYWALLLQRKVLIWKPYSSKFFHFPWQPHTASDCLPEALKNAWGFPNENILAQCRFANQKFYEKVMGVITK